MTYTLYLQQFNIVIIYYFVSKPTPDPFVMLTRISHNYSITKNKVNLGIFKIHKESNNYDGHI